MGAEAATLTLGTGGAILALEGVIATLGSIGGTNFWNIVGWVCLAIAVVLLVVLLVALIVENWEAICEFFAGIWAWLTEKATIVYEWVMNTAVPWIVDTATSVWNAITTTADKVGRRAEKQAKALADAMAAAIAAGLTLLKDDAVYLINMVRAGKYEKKKWGLLPGLHDFPNDRGGDPKYKYGTTKNGISGRYVEGSYIRYHIRLGNMDSIMIREYMTFWEARILEKQLIYLYFCQHGAFPPGNSKLG